MSPPVHGLTSPGGPSLLPGAFYEGFYLPSTEISILSLVILILVRDIILPLIKGDPLVKILQALEKINATWDANQSRIDDLHEWHKPDPTGRQTWKDDSIVKAIQTDVGRLFSQINDGVQDIKAEITAIPVKCLLKDRDKKNG
jgi:hypothetical protein